MDARAVVALLRARSALASRDRWSHALADMRAFALARSPFYREFHRGLEAAPLDALPVLTKATVMERFDELVTDRDVRLSAVEAHLASGPDGRPFALIDAIEGREEDVLHLSGIAIHPNVFHTALEPVPVGARQVVEEAGGLLVLLAQPTEGVVDADVATRVHAALGQAGADCVRVRTERVDAIPRTALGKAPLVRELRRERDEPLLAATQSSF